MVRASTRTTHSGHLWMAQTERMRKRIGGAELIVCVVYDDADGAEMSFVRNWQRTSDGPIGVRVDDQMAENVGPYL